MSDKKHLPFDSGANRDAGHRITFGPTREGISRLYDDVTHRKGNHIWLDLSGGRSGKTKLAVNLIDSSINQGGRHECDC